MSHLTTKPVTNQSLLAVLPSSENCYLSLNSAVLDKASCCLIEIFVYQVNSHVSTPDNNKIFHNSQYNESDQPDGMQGFEMDPLNCLGKHNIKHVSFRIPLEILKCYESVAWRNLPTVSDINNPP